MDLYGDDSGVHSATDAAANVHDLDRTADAFYITTEDAGETHMKSAMFMTEVDKPKECVSSVLILCTISCILSIVGSLIIFGTYVAIPETRNFTRKLIVCLTVADFLTAAGYILGTSNCAFNNGSGGNVCQVQSYITTYSSLVSFLLTIMTAVHLYITVVRQPDFPTKRRLMLFNLISWITPAIVIAVAGNQDVLGASDLKGTGGRGTGPWCWVKTTVGHHVMWQLVTGKAWEIACYLITTTLYVLLKLFLLIRHPHERFRTFHSSLRDEDHNFLYVWYFFYIIRLWGTIRFFIAWFKPTISPDSTAMTVLLHMQAFGDPAQAFCNCLLFCFFDRTVRERLFYGCSRRMCKYKELKDPSHDDDKRAIHGQSGDIVGQNSSLHGSDPINYGSTNSHVVDSEDAYSCTYDSPVSTPCFTPRLSPASFTSIPSDT